VGRSDLIKAARTEAKAHNYDFTLWPTLWGRFDDRYNYIWNKRLFKASSISSIPVEAGIYTFIIMPMIANHPSCAYLMYAGKTKNLRQRFKQYIEVQKGTRRHNPKVELGLEQFMEHNYLFFYYSLHDESCINEYEQALIDGFAPPWNDKKTISCEVGDIMRAF